MNERFRVTKPCPDGIAVRDMIEERFRALDAVSARDVTETLSIFGPGYNCRYTISRPKNTGDRHDEYDTAVMAVFDDLRPEYPNLSVEWNDL